MSNKNKNLEKIKIILVGNSGVGKTTIINRYYNSSFVNEMASTMSMNYIEKKIIIDEKCYNLSIWDTVGQEQYRSCNKLFIKNSNIVIFVYDITSIPSFKELNYWHETIENELGQNPYLAIAGNKFDLIEEEKITEIEGKELAQKWCAYFALLSAKTDPIGIDNFFYNIVKEYLNENKGLFNYRLNTIELDSNVSKKKNANNRCCSGRKSIEKEKEIKIIFIGGNKSGKNIIINKILGNRISINYEYEYNNNIIENNYSYEMENKKRIVVNILNINEDSFETPKFIELIKHCKIFFLVFNIYNKDTFNILNKWFEKIKKNSNSKKIFVNILGTEIGNIGDNINDENNSVKYEEGEKLAKKIGGNFKMVSIDDTISLRNLIKINVEKYLNF